jgi:hypothetical protein
MDMPVLAKVPESAAGLLRVSCERLGAAAPLIGAFGRVLSPAVALNLFLLLSGSTSMM